MQNIANRLDMFFEVLSGRIWSTGFIIMFILVGVYFTFLTGFIQVRKFPTIIRETLIKQFTGNHHTGGEGVISSFQAMCTSLAGCVGNGNIVGVTTAILAGGPGAVFGCGLLAFLEWLPNIRR